MSQPEPPEEPGEGRTTLRRLGDRRRALQAAASDGRSRRVLRSTRRWAIISALALIGAAVLVQGLFTSSAALAAEAARAWPPMGTGLLQILSGSALLLLAWWLVRAGIERPRGLVVLGFLLLLSAPPWGWIFGDGGHLVGMLLMLGVAVAAGRVYRRSRPEQSA